MNSRTWRGFLALCSALLLLAAVQCAATDDVDTEGALPTLTFMFPVLSVTQYHPFYIAQELGYFEEEGLQVEFQAAGGSSAAIQQLLAGNADAALPSPGAFLNAVARGHELVWISSYQYANIFTLVTPADSGISSIAGLNGKKVGVSELSGGEVPLVRAVLRGAGLEEGETVDIVPVGEGAALTVNVLTTGQVDAYSSNLFDVAAIEAAGIDMNVILPEDVQNYPSNGIVTTPRTLEEKRSQIVGLARAVAKAIVFARSNDAAAMEIAARVAPEEFDDETLAQSAWEAARVLKTPPQELTEQPIGTHFLEGFQAYHDFLLQGSEEEGALPEPVDLSTVLDSSLLTEINTFDKEAIERQAQRY